jgi:predicted RNase H-like HicB family nuclease
MLKNKRKTSIKIAICIEPDGTGYHAYCPALKGLHTSGKTVEEARLNVLNAISAYMESMEKHGDPIPVGIIDRCDKPAAAANKASSKTQSFIEELELVTV